MAANKRDPSRGLDAWAQAGGNFIDPETRYTSGTVRRYPNTHCSTGKPGFTGAPVEARGGVDERLSGASRLATLHILQSQQLMFRKNATRASVRGFGTQGRTPHFRRR